MEEEIHQLGVFFVEEAGKYIRGLELHLAPMTVLGRFSANFGVGPKHCAWLWHLAADHLYELDYNVKRIHLLWTLNILKTDDTEAVMNGRWGADEKTIQKWLYVVLEGLGRIGAVSMVGRLLVGV